MALDPHHLRAFLMRMHALDEPWAELAETVTAQHIVEAVRGSEDLAGYVVVHLTTDERPDARALGVQVQGMLLAQAARRDLVRARLKAALQGDQAQLEAMARLPPELLASAVYRKHALRRQTMEALRRHHTDAAVALSRALSDLDAGDARALLLQEIHHVQAAIDEMRRAQLD